ETRPPIMAGPMGRAERPLSVVSLTAGSAANEKLAHSTTKQHSKVVKPVTRTFGASARVQLRTLSAAVNRRLAQARRGLRQSSAAFGGGCEVTSARGLTQSKTWRRVGRFMAREWVIHAWAATAMADSSIGRGGS